jgi:hypothetical protein
MVAENPRQRSAPALEEGKDSAVVNMQQDDAMEPTALDAAARDDIRVSKSLSKIFWFPYMRDQKICNPNETTSGVAQPELHHHSKPPGQASALCATRTHTPGSSLN